MILHEVLKWKLEMHMAVKNIQYLFILNPNTLSLSILGVGGGRSKYLHMFYLTILKCLKL